MTDKLDFEEVMEVLSEAHTDRGLYTTAEDEMFIMEFESYGALYQALFDIRNGGLVLNDLDAEEEVFST